MVKKQIDLHAAWTNTPNGTPKKRIQLFKDMANVIKDPVLFKKFRTLQSLHESVSGNNWNNRAMTYMKYMSENNPRLILDNLEKIQDSDRIGSPILFNFSIGGQNVTLSDSAVHPLYLITKVQERFGPLPNDMNIIEIGCGFGINTKIFHDIIGYKNYHHIDVPEMLELQRQYLEASDVNDIVYVNPYTDLDNIFPHYNFFISDFAYTEFSPELKHLYFESVIKRCDRGIMLGKMKIKGKLPNNLTANDWAKFTELFDCECISNKAYKEMIMYFSRRN